MNAGGVTDGIITSILNMTYLAVIVIVIILDVMNALYAGGGRYGAYPKNH